jgi:hypothetical protein
MIQTVLKSNKLNPSLFDQTSALDIAKNLLELSKNLLKLIETDEKDLINALKNILPNLSISIKVLH